MLGNEKPNKRKMEYQGPLNGLFLCMELNSLVKWFPQRSYKEERGEGYKGGDADEALTHRI